jgi:hypothetical protein
LDRLTRARHPLLLAALAVVLSLPALGLGFQLDDHFLRLALSRPAMIPAWARPATDAFAFFTGDTAFTRQARDMGSVPWWVDEQLKLAFFRPLSGLTHGIDFALWPSSPALMHAHSLLWLGLCVALCAVLYRELEMPPRAAALAALLFAVDDAHGTPAAWIANRNALVGTAFALMCLIAHHRWRARAWRPGAVLAPAALLLGLLSGEIALAAGGYLLGYALFAERAPWRSRLLSLVPCGLTGLAWAIAYRTLGYGTAHSTLYVDPVASPLRFVAALIQRGPVLCFGQWALPADLNGMLSAGAQQVYWGIGVMTCAAVGLLLAPLLRADRNARFLATGMLLSLVPAAATFPSNRLLMLTGVGGFGLLGAWMTSSNEPAPRNAAAGTGRRIAFPIAVAIHLVLAPLGLLGAASGVRLLGDVPARAARSLPRDPQIAGEHLLIVNAPSAFFVSQSLLEHSLSGAPMPAYAHVLGSGLGRMTVHRPDTRTLLISPAGGYLLPPGTRGRDDDAPPPVDQYHILGIFDRLYRHDPFVAGHRIDLAGFSVEIVDVTEDGRPAAARFTFEKPLEDPSHRWLQWRSGGYVPFEPPGVDATIVLPAAEVWPGS